MDRRPTMYDVAQAAGVSASTVSRAFSRPGRVDAETAARIFDVAKRLGYRSRALTGSVTGRTRSLALVVTDITNPYYADIIRGAHDAAAELGYTVLLSHTQEDAQIERTWTERELGAVEGILLASSRMSDKSIRTMAKQKPIVTLNRRLPEVPCILIDYPSGVKQAVEHLSALGHDAMTYLAGPESSWADGIRWQALREMTQRLDIRLRRVGPCNTPTVEAGFGRTRQIVDQGAAAIVAYNDAMAIGVLKGLVRMGLSVPGDVSIVGFDNTILAEITEPELTTVAAPLRAMGESAVRNLVTMMGGALPSREPIVMPVRLVVRGSTGERNRGPRVHGNRGQ